jgi:hypothetical protein
MSEHRFRFCFKVLSLPVVAMLLASYWFLHSVPVRAQVSQNSKVRDLQAQRLTTLSNLVAITREHYQNGEVSSDELLSVTRQEMEAELDLCTSAEERVAILERVVDGAKLQEAQAANLAANKLLAKRALLKATADRLQQEILLEQARDRMNAER